MRDVTIGLTRLMELRDQQRLLHNRSVTLSSLLGSTTRAAEVALWKAESLPRHAEIAEHLRAVLGALAAATAALEVRPPLTHAEDLKLIMNKEIR